MYHTFLESTVASRLWTKVTRKHIDPAFFAEHGQPVSEEAAALLVVSVVHSYDFSYPVFGMLSTVCHLDAD